MCSIFIITDYDVRCFVRGSSDGLHLLIPYYYYLESVSLLVPNRILEKLVCLILTLNVKPALPLDALRRRMPSTIILAYSMDVRPRLI